MIILADETLETFFGHEFAQSFQLTEAPIERQSSLSREIFDSLFAAGSRFASGRGSRRPGLSRTSSKAPSSNTLSSMASADNQVSNPKSDQIGSPSEDSGTSQVVQATTTPPSVGTQEEIQKENDVDDDEDEEYGDDVLEEVDRLLDEFEKS
jgi:hypothetical protein